MKAYLIISNIHFFPKSAILHQKRRLRQHAGTTTIVLSKKKRLRQHGGTKTMVLVKKSCLKNQTNVDFYFDLIFYVSITIKNHVSSVVETLC